MLLILESLHDLSIPQYREFHRTQDIRCLGSSKILSAHSRGLGSLCQLRISRASDGFGDLPRLAGADRYSSTSVSELSHFHIYLHEIGSHNFQQNTVSELELDSGYECIFISAVSMQVSK